MKNWWKALKSVFSPQSITDKVKKEFETRDQQHFREQPTAYDTKLQQIIRDSRLPPKDSRVAKFTISVQDDRKKK